MAQRPIKKVQIKKKETKYFKNSKKRKDAISLIQKEVSKKTLQILEEKNKDL